MQSCLQQAVKKKPALTAIHLDSQGVHVQTQMQKGQMTCSSAKHGIYSQPRHVQCTICTQEFPYISKHTLTKHKRHTHINACSHTNTHKFTLMILHIHTCILSYILHVHTHIYTGLHTHAHTPMHTCMPTLTPHSADCQPSTMAAYMSPHSYLKQQHTTRLRQRDRGNALGENESPRQKDLTKCHQKGRHDQLWLQETAGNSSALL